MTAIHETAYPRIRSAVTPKELIELYTPSADELLFAERHAKSAVARLGLLTHLKVFQRLGRFPHTDSVPASIFRHIAETAGLTFAPDSIGKYKSGRFGSRQAPLVRDFLKVRAFSEAGEQIMTEALTEAARSKDIIADIINAGIETLVRERYELPAFDTLLRAAKQARARENRTYYQLISAALSVPQKTAIAGLLSRETGESKSPWNALKREPGQPTVKRIREYTGHLRWLRSLCPVPEALTGIPETKLQRFADEAKALNVSQMNRLPSPKRFTLAAALIQTQTAQALDDLTEMYLRRVGKLHRLGNEALKEYRLKNQEQTDVLIGLLGQIADGWQAGETPEQRHRTVDGLIGDKAESIREQCEAHLGYSGNNYLPFLPPLFKGCRKLCFEVLEILRPVSTTTDKSLEEAIAFLLRNRDARGERLPVSFPAAAASTAKAAAEPQTTGNGKAQGKAEAAESFLDLSFIPRRWWQTVTGIPARNLPIRSVDRKYFELCVFSCAMQDIKSGDLCVPGGERFGDYREQLISWEEYEVKIKAYCEQAGISSDPAAFVAAACKRLTNTIRKVDAAFPENAAVSIKNGEPVVKKIEKLADPEGFALIDRLLTDRLPECSIVDILTDTEHWLNWTKPFGPLSGFEGRVERPQERYIATTFCYATNMGPAQAARCLTGFDRRQVAYINRRHATEARQLAIITLIINAYNRLVLPQFWGSGESAAADGTPWDVYEQNLLCEYHIRYGGWGGIGYYHVSDRYIALFSNFIACGVWEAVHILDGLLRNRSDIRPDTLHADTQGQSEAVFGLAYLLGIKLMPRIRNWRDLTFYRPDDNLSVQHIGELLSETIDGELIKIHLPDMLRIALSISEGKIHASAILRRLGTASRKSKLYQAFAELGRLTRTIFLLDFIHDAELRHTVTTATNTAETWNGFTKWIAFGGDGVIRQTSREEQRRFIRYNHIAANLIVFHNSVTMTKILQQLIDEGHPVTKEILARLSPCKIGHINRFGQIEMRFDRKPDPVVEDLRL